MRNIYRPCQINIFSLRPANKGSNGKEEDLLEYVLKGLQPYRIIDPEWY